MENVPWSELGKQNVKAEKVYNSNALRMEVNRKLTNTDKINQLSYKSTHYDETCGPHLLLLSLLHIFVFGLEIFFPVTASSLFGPFKSQESCCLDFCKSVSRRTSCHSFIQY